LQKAIGDSVMTADYDQDQLHATLENIQ